MSLPSWCADDVQTITYILWLIMVLGAVFNIFWNVYGIIKMLIQHQITPTSRIFRILYIIINILFIISSVTLTIHIAMSLICSKPFLWSIIGLIGDCYTWGLNILYLLYLYRLKLTFDETRFGISNYIFLLLWFGFIIQTIIPPLTAYFFLRHGSEINWELATLTHVAGIVISFIFNLLLLCIYIRKLYILIKCTMQTHGNTGSTKLINTKHFAARLKKLLYPAIRFMICAFISMISSNLLSILGFVRSLVYDTMMLYTLHIMLIVLDQTINSLFLYLQFPFGDISYYFYCSNVHFCVQKCISSQISHYN
eukprot:144646_1